MIFEVWVILGFIQDHFGVSVAVLSAMGAWLGPHRLVHEGRWVPFLAASCRSAGPEMELKRRILDVKLEVNGNQNWSKIRSKINAKMKMIFNMLLDRFSRICGARIDHKIKELRSQI